MQLEGAPQALLRFLRVTGADQQIQRCSMTSEKIGGDMPADIAGRPGQKDGHGAPSARVCFALFILNFIEGGILVAPLLTRLHSRGLDESCGGLAPPADGLQSKDRSSGAAPECEY